MSFDAGSIEATLRLRRDQFQRDLEQERAEMRRFVQQQWDLKVNLDTRAIDLAIARLEARFEALRHSLERTIRMQTSTTNAPGSGGNQGLIGGDPGLLRRLQQQVATPGGIGIIGTGTDQTLQRLLRLQLTQSLQNRQGTPLYGLGPSGSQQQKITQDITQRVVNPADQVPSDVTQRVHRIVYEDVHGGGGDGFIGRLRGGAPSGGFGGDANRAGFFSRLGGGIGPGIPGVRPLYATIAALAGPLLGALPAGIGALGALGIGAGGGALLATQLPGVKKQAIEIGHTFLDVFTEAAKGMLKPLQQIFGQIPKFLKSIEPELHAMFSAVGPLLGPLVRGLESLIKNLLPGITAMFRASLPAVRAFGGILGTLGKDIGQMFKDFAPVMKASSVVLTALFDIISGLLPVIGKLAGIFATTLAPIFKIFAGVLRDLEPLFLTLGEIIAGLARAALGALVGLFRALATVVKDVAPSLTILAKTLGQVFEIMERSGVFGALGTALEKIAPMLADLINTLVLGLAPALPDIIKLLALFADAAVEELVQAFEGLLPIVIELVKQLLPPLLSIIKDLMPLFVFLAKVCSESVVIAFKVWTPVLQFVVKIIGWLAQGIAGLIHFVTHLKEVWMSVWNTVLGAFRWVVNRILDFFQFLLDGAALAFGWIPGIGDKLRGAAAHFRTFRDNVNDSLSGINDRTVNVGVTFGTAYEGGGGKIIDYYSTGPPRQMARGGRILDGTTPTADDVLIRASKDETVVSAAHSRMLAPVFARLGVPGYASGGKVGDGGVNLAGGLPSHHGIQAAVWPTVEKLASTLIGSASFNAIIGAILARMAVSYVGRVPYVYGGVTTDGWDCSGMVWNLLHRLNYWPPRTSFDMWDWVRKVPVGFPGALAFFAGADGTASNPGHVGIYLGGGQYASAYGTGYGTTIEPIYGSSGAFSGFGIPPHRGYDRGGILPPGTHIVQNKTGSNELVLTPSESQAFVAWVRGGHRNQPLIGTYTTAYYGTGDTTKALRELTHTLRVAQLQATVTT